MTTPWITGFTGIRIHPFDLADEQIDVRDIAHSLALTCRFRGHCRTFYSVAQHSVLAAQLAPAGVKMAALMHDAAEAYLLDAVRPIKEYLSVTGIPFSDMEEQVTRQIFATYGIAWPSDEDWDTVKVIDNRLVMTEGRDLGFDTSDWNITQFPYAMTIEPWPWEKAEERFLSCFRCLDLDPLGDKCKSAG